MIPTNSFPTIQFIGTQRSGSNLLRVMLNQLPEISAPHPPHILKTFFPLLDAHYDLQNENGFRALVKDVCDWVNCNPVSWENCFLDADVILKACKKNTLLEIFCWAHEYKTVCDKAQIWCCKSMESVHYINEIEESGTHPYYLHLFRDGRDVAVSFLKAIVGPKHIYFLAQKWAEEQELSLEVRNRVGDGRFISISYENLLADPKEVLQHLCEKLNLTYSDSMFQYFSSHESINTAGSGKMWENLSKPILTDNHDKYIKELTDEEILIFESVAGPTLEKLGYHCKYPNRERIKEFSPDQVSRFKELGEARAKGVLNSAEGFEIEKRRPQEELLNRIRTRKVNVI